MGHVTDVKKKTAGATLRSKMTTLCVVVVCFDISYNNKWYLHFGLFLSMSMLTWSCLCHAIDGGETIKRPPPLAGDVYAAIPPSGKQCRVLHRPLTFPGAFLYGIF